MTAVVPDTALHERVRDFISADRPMLIGGEWVWSASGRTFETIDPATARPLTSVAHGDASDVDRAVRAARTAFEDGLAIAKALSARDPGNTEWKRDLAVSFAKLGQVAEAKGERSAARTAAGTPSSCRLWASISQAWRSISHLPAMQAIRGAASGGRSAGCSSRISSSSSSMPLAMRLARFWFPLTTRMSKTSPCPNNPLMSRDSCGSSRSLLTGAVRWRR